MTRVAATAVAVLLSCAACGLSAPLPPQPTVPRVAASQRPDPSAAIRPPGPLRGEPRRPDLLVIAKRTIPSRLRVALEGLDGVRGSELLSVGSVPLGERTLTVAAVDPGTYRQFTPTRTARADAVWRSVAAGELAASPDVGGTLPRPLGGALPLRVDDDEVRLRIGSYATTVPRVDAVVNYRRGEQLGMTPDNALLLSLDAGANAEADATAAVERLVGKHATVVQLARHSGSQLAYLSGGAVARAVGTFEYEYLEDGTVRPDPQWVAANLRTESVPILGRVTCHRVMLPQLRAALAEVRRQGLAGAIDPGDFGGCYAPRFIGHDPAKGLSLHTWGIAVDLNVAQNQRGTPGRIDRRVVRIFQRWGFAWGGDWSWTDPMHFELAALVR